MKARLSDSSRQVSISCLHVPQDVYHSCLMLYRQSALLSYALRAVLQDGEHELVMEEGKRDGLNMPPTISIRAKQATLDRLLNSFDPYRTEQAKNDTVKIPLRTAVGFFRMDVETKTLIRMLLIAVFQTDYLKAFSAAKNRGVPYAGGTCLHEIFTAVGSLHHLQRTQHLHAKSLDPSLTERLREFAL